MKLTLFGQKFQVISINFTENGIQITYLDSDYNTPKIKMVGMTENEFKKSVDWE